MLPLPSLPRIVGRQNNRNNVPARTPEEYYRRAVFLPFLDGILTQISLRFCNHEAAVLRLCGLLPKFAPNVSFRDIEEGVDHYAALLPCSVEAVELEFQTWQILCRAMDNPPYDCMKCSAYVRQNILSGNSLSAAVHFRNSTSVHSNSGTYVFCVKSI
jgi:hypothetical protein